MKTPAAQTDATARAAIRLALVGDAQSDTDVSNDTAAVGAFAAAIAPDASNVARAASVEVADVAAFTQRLAALTVAALSAPSPASSATSTSPSPSMSTAPAATASMPDPTADGSSAEGSSAAVRGGRSSAELVELLASLEVLKSAAAAAQAVAAVRLDQVVRAEQDAAGLRKAKQGGGVGAMVGLARRESPWKGARLLGLAKALVAELPGTLDALREGALGEWAATVAAQETACLEPDDRLLVDDELAGTPQARERLSQMSVEEVRAAYRAATYRADPQAVVDRGRHAVKDRRVSFRPAADAMSWVSGFLPAADGVACRKVLEDYASTRRSQGDERGRGQLMADRFVALLTGRDAADPIPVEVQLVLTRDDLAAASRPAPSDSPADPTAGSAGCPTCDSKDFAAAEGDGSAKAGSAQTDTAPTDAERVGSGGGGGCGAGWLVGYGPVPAETVRALLAPRPVPEGFRLVQEHGFLTLRVRSSVLPTVPLERRPTAEELRGYQACQRNLDAVLRAALAANTSSSRAASSAPGAPGAQGAPGAATGDGTGRPRLRVVGADERAVQPPVAPLVPAADPGCDAEPDPEPDRPAEAAPGSAVRWLDEARVRVRRLLADPFTGTVVDREPRRRLFSAGERALVTARDRVCAMPWCDAVIREIDHAMPYSDGGPTVIANAQGLCQACNLVKELPGWSHRREPDGHGSTFLEVTTPAGQRYTSRPPDTMAYQRRRQHGR
ncbi:hypothetical protein GCM10025862_34900 [Arsenicicoccus piscis]|uniref:HNH nuclease domain-containing protein n=2 Tax=Arsenicicoccus piscis TaxID=673954 RepID=A0ABQ6HVC2_9MICO|nr:hypothetical protein GCM10025862_34900 [Arsenicicoccus piscis]